MDAALSFWNLRRVLVCGVTSPLGAALAELLTEQGAEVSGIVTANPGDESRFLANKLYERVRPIRGSSIHPRPIAMALSANEIEVIIDTTLTQAKTTYALLAAARVAVPHAAMTIGIAGPASRLLPMANRFRNAKCNPIGVTVVPDDIEMAREQLATTARRTVLRDPAVLVGWTDIAALRKLAA